MREAFRSLALWQALFEAHDVPDVITGSDGKSLCLHDVLYLYECRALLSPRQRQAIELCLYENVLEKEAARRMGVSETNPVAMYATNGLRRILDLVESGALPRYREVA